jgi:hypothetical protein
MPAAGRGLGETMMDARLTVLLFSVDQALIKQHQSFYRVPRALARWNSSCLPRYHKNGFTDTTDKPTLSCDAMLYDVR